MLGDHIVRFNYVRLIQINGSAIHAFDKIDLLFVYNTVSYLRFKDRRYTRLFLVTPTKLVDNSYIQDMLRSSGECLVNAGVYSPSKRISFTSNIEVSDTNDTPCNNFYINRILQSTSSNMIINIFYGI